MEGQPPPITKYLDSSSKAVDLLNLCRRIIAGWQYQDERKFGNFVKLNKAPSADPGTNPIAYQLIQQCLKFNAFKATPEMIPFLSSLSTTRYSVTIQNSGDPITAKKFEADPTQDLKPEELLKIYWRLRLRFSSDIPLVIVARLVDEFKRLGYEGFLLPNGKVVPFDSMNLLYFWFAPKELNVIDYNLPEGTRDRFPFTGDFACVNPVIEDMSIPFDPVDGFLSDHEVIVFNLPNESKGTGKLMILDATCAGFGMTGINGDLLFWGLLDDYLKAFPAKKLILKGFPISKNAVGKMNPEIDGLPYLHPLMNAVMFNFKSDSCGYCGEVERKDNPEMKLKKCSKCKKVFYCDGLCQKLGWKCHKFGCKSN